MMYDTHKYHHFSILLFAFFHLLTEKTQNLKQKRQKESIPANSSCKYSGRKKLLKINFHFIPLLYRSLDSVLAYWKYILHSHTCYLTMTRTADIEGKRKTENGLFQIQFYLYPFSFVHLIQRMGAIAVGRTDHTNTT